MDERLAAAEAKMDKRQESALEELMSLDTDSLATDKQKALYALLLTQAKDKSYMLSKDDTLINDAVRYYETTDDNYHKMLALHYQGRVMMVDQDYSHSIIALLKSLKLAEETNDPFWKGMSARSLADIYNDLGSINEQLRYAEIEEEGFRQYGAQPYVDYAILDYARANCAKGNYDKTKRLSYNLLDSADTHNDPFLALDAKSIMAANELKNGSEENALPILEEIISSGYAHPQDSAYLAWAYAKVGQSKDALRLLKSVPTVAKSLNEMSLYTVYKQLGMTDEALAALESSDSTMDAHFLRLMSLGITNSVSDFFTWQKQKENAEHRSTMTTAFSIIAILFLVSLSLTGFILYYKKKREAIDTERVLFAKQLTDELSKGKEDFDEVEKERSLLAQKYCQLEEELTRKENELEQSKKEFTQATDHLQYEQEKKQAELKRNLEELTKTNSHLQADLEHKKEEASRITKDTLDKILPTWPTILQRLCDTFHQNETHPDRYQRISKCVEKIINEFSVNEDRISRLEAEVNECNKNICADFKRELPGLKDIDYKIFLFNILGFSTSVIALLTETKDTIVYNRKRHLKDKIRRLSPSRMAEYIQILS